MLAVWTALGAATLYLILKYTQRKKYNLPPGPRGLPFVGNALQLDKDKPHDTITKWSEEYGDIFYIENFGKPTIVLNSFDTIYEGLVTQANRFAGRVDTYRNKVANAYCPDIISRQFSHKWLYRKKLALQTLKMYGDNLGSLETISLDLIDEMVKELRSVADQGPTDVYPIYHRCVTGIMSSILYGEKLPQKTVTAILESLEKSAVILNPSSIYAVFDMMPLIRYVPGPSRWHDTLVECVTKFVSIVSTQVDKRKVDSDPGNPNCVCDGLLDHQRKAKESGSEDRLSDDEILGINLNVLGAGTFTTSTTINALIAVMIHKPKIQEKMSREIQSHIGERSPKLTDRKKLHYVEAAILEVLRYSSIITLNVPHCTLEDAQIEGYDIPKGTMVFFNLWKLHHDSEYWDEPWEFKPERYLDENGEVVPADHINRKRLLAFGASRRVCVGETLARNRLFLIITSMVQHFKFLPAGPDEMPLHDPRDYKTSFGIEPHWYRLKVELRQ